jgi:hypothetical protein
MPLFVIFLMSKVVQISQCANSRAQPRRAATGAVADPIQDARGGSEMALWRRVVEVLTAIGKAAMGPTPPTSPVDRARVCAHRHDAIRLAPFAR